LSGYRVKWFKRPKERMDTKCRTPVVGWKGGGLGVGIVDSVERVWMELRGIIGWVVIFLCKCNYTT
jgi:hypothetical protein